MKLFTTFAAGLLLWGSTTAFAQTRIGVNQSNGIRLGKTTVSKTYHESDNPKYQGYEFSYTLTYPLSGDNSEILKCARTLYNQVIFGKAVNISPVDMAKADIINEGAKFLEEYADSDFLDTMQSVYEYYCRSVDVVYNRSGFLSLSGARWSDMGGAHYLYAGSFGAVIDLNAKRFLSVSDLIPESSEEALTEELRKDLVRQGILKEELDDNSQKYYYPVINVELSDDFYISDNGVTWITESYNYWSTLEATVDWATMLKYLSPYSPLLPLAKAKAGVN
jgi:hypothetical protein